MNRTSFVMMKLKKIQYNSKKNIITALVKTDKNIVIRKVQLFCQKVELLLRKNKIKNLSVGFL